MLKDINYIKVKKVASTNDHLKKLTIEKDLPEGYVVVTNYQKNGRGQEESYWESAPGDNLTISLLLRPTFLLAENIFMVSKVISLGIISYLIKLDKCFTIKWPNDIYYCNKKLGGILIENQLLGNKLNFTIVGIGININQEVFKSNAPNPISLKNIFSKNFDLNECLNDILTQIGIWYNVLNNGLTDKINKTYFAHLYRNNSYYEYKAENRIFKAQIKSVDNDGKITMETTDGLLRTFYFKEVEFVNSNF